VSALVVLADHDLRQPPPRPSEIADEGELPQAAGTPIGP